MQQPPPEPLFQWFVTNGPGLLNAALCLAATWLLLTWLLWMFGLGRFKRSPAATDGAAGAAEVTFLNAFLLNIIKDFRNLLAFAITLLFALILVIAIAVAGGHDLRMDAIQVVTASLGPLVGSLMGYYFGERAGLLDASGGSTRPSPPSPATQTTPTDGSPRGITPVGTPGAPETPSPGGGPSGEPVRDAGPDEPPPGPPEEPEG